MFLLFLFYFAIAAEDDCVPFSPRVQLGDYYSDQSKEKIIILFNTKQACPLAHLILSYQDNHKDVSVSSTEILDMSEDYGKQNKYKIHIHKVILKDVIPGESYDYTPLGSEDKTDEFGTYQFRVPHKAPKEATRLVIMGNMDISEYSESTFVWFQAMKFFRTQLDAVIYPGRISVDLEARNCQIGEKFLKQFSEITAIWPLMILPGYSDLGDNGKGTFFYSQFTKTDFITSYDLGLVRVYQIDMYKVPEDYNTSLIDMVQDIYLPLPTIIKWKVLITNFPSLCMIEGDGFCEGFDDNQVRDSFFEIYSRAGFHLIIDSYHEMYIRTYFEKGSEKNAYVFNGKPVLITSGAGGCDSDYSEHQYYEYEGTQSIHQQQSVGVLTASNETHLHYQQVSTKDNDVIDEVYIIKGQPPKPSKSAFYLVLITTMVVLIGIAILVCKRMGISFSKKSESDKLVGENEMSSID